MFAITTRRALIGILMSSSLMSASAFASKTDCSMNAYYAENTGNGEASPTPYAIWAIQKGCGKSASKPIPLSAKDVEYLRYANSVGDATPMTFMEYHFPSKPSAAPKVITAEEREYLNFANSFGDATPPSFAEWKAGNSMMARQPAAVTVEAPKDNWDINVKLMSETTEQTPTEQKVN